MTQDENRKQKKGVRRALLTMLGGLMAAPAVAGAEPTSLTPEEKAARKAQKAQKAKGKGEKGQNAGLDPQDSVVYKTVGGVSLSLFVYRPAEQAPGARLPCVVFFHGGGYHSGSADRKFRQIGPALAKFGVLAISAQYRLLEEGEAVPKDAIEDGRSAMRYVRSHAQALGCDPNRLAAAGASAGGHLALMTALKSPFDDPADDLKISPKPQALILFNAPYNLEHYKSAQALALSPYHLVGGDFPPTLALHGTADKTVPFQQATQFKEKAASLGIKDFNLMPYEGRGHSFFMPNKGDGSDFNTAMEQVGSFLKRLGWAA
jgi:acetyl esterase